jgi:hypothetical protein
LAVLDHFGLQLLLQLAYPSLCFPSSVVGLPRPLFGVLSAILSAVGALVLGRELHSQICHLLPQCRYHVGSDIVGDASSDIGSDIGQGSYQVVSRNSMRFRAVVGDIWRDIGSYVIGDAGSVGVRPCQKCRGDKYVAEAVITDLFRPAVSLGEPTRGAYRNASCSG